METQPVRRGLSDETSHINGFHGSMEGSRTNPPSSSLLQDLLREKRAESRHPIRTSVSLSNSDSYDSREVQSSPSGPTSGRSDRNGRRPSGLGGRSPKEMGVREMEEYISKINSLNFDLKLELFHRRQRADAQDEKIRTLESENMEAQQINEELLQELERRDQAIQEAVSLICDLEHKLETIGLQSDFVESSMLPPSSPPCIPEVSYGTPRSQKQQQSLGSNSVSPSRQPGPMTPAQRSARRQPSFLRENSGSTSALRRLYMEDYSNNRHLMSPVPTTRPASLFSSDEDREIARIDRLKSPSLSVLSESSFMSIYGKFKDQQTGLPSTRLDSDETVRPAIDEDTPALQRSEISQDARINQWMEQKDSPSRKLRDPRNPSGAVRGEQMSSIEQVLQKEGPPSQQKRSANSLKEKILPYSADERDIIPSLSFNGPMFGTGIKMTTPDTLRTDSRPLLSRTPVPSDSASSSGRYLQKSTSGRSLPQIPSQSSMDIGNDRHDLPDELDGGDDESTRADPDTEEYGIATILETTNMTLKKLGLEPTASPNRAHYGMNMMFDGTDYFPRSLAGQKAYESHASEPGARYRSAKASTVEHLQPGSTVLAEQDWLRHKNLKKTPSPSRYVQHPQEFKNPQAQHYQQLVTPPQSTNTNSEEDYNKIKRTSSLRHAASKPKITAPLSTRASLANRFFRRSLSLGPTAPDDKPEPSPIVESPPSDTTNRRARSSSITPHPLSKQQYYSPPKRLPSRPVPARPSTADSSGGMSNYMSSRHGQVYYDSTTTSEEVVVTPSASSRDDIGVGVADDEGDGDVGRRGGVGLRLDGRDMAEVVEAPKRWGLGRTASLKIKKGLGWKKNDG